MTHKKSLNGDLRFMISTRGRDGRYGPQSKDMHLSDLINLFTTATVTEQSPSTIMEGANKSYGTRAFTGNPLILND